MDGSQLPSLDGVLVTADNPARTDLPGMDHARCAALHNYLVHYACIANGLSPVGVQENTWFAVYGAEAEVIRSRLDPSLAVFLQAALVPPRAAYGYMPLFFWASQLMAPDWSEFFDNQTGDLYDMPDDSLVRLYDSIIGQGGSSTGGMLYHQSSHRAAFFMDLWDHDYALPPEKHPELWHPLETILSNWIDLIRLGKVTTAPQDVPALFGSEKVGLWEWRPYGDAQITTCVNAWDRLCAAIEARLPPPPPPTVSTTSATPNATTVEWQPLLSPSVLDAALVPQTCFARAFLSHARRPSKFRYIAPGLLLPPSEPAAFAALQPFTRLRRGPPDIPSICLFPSHETVNITTPSPDRIPESFRSNFNERFPARDPSPRTVQPPSPPPPPPPPTVIRAGVYSAHVDRARYDIAEEGFWLLLPYALRSARKSDGSVTEVESAGELFQHGYKPFGGEYWRPQRLERLLDHWCRLVEGGVWTVGREGVEGGIEKYREADDEGRGWEYVIPPSW